ncbi:MAG: hypothetical protein PSX36_08825 [bacterium]|nr:hypothetical protein [bacterium]
MDSLDYLISPIYLAIILLLAHKFTLKQRQTKPIYRYFLRGLILKMFGAVSLGMVYFYYYKGGDTINYFLTAKGFVNTLLENPDNFFHLYFGDPTASEFYLMNTGSEFVYWVRDPFAFTVSKYFVPIVLICMKSYLASAVVVASICYLGVWRLFLVFVREFPHLEKQFAWSILYIPSVVFWGSGIMKDSITFSATCLYVHGFYWFFTQRVWKVKYLLALGLGAFLLLTIKPYILFALLPGSVLWFVALRVTRIKSAFFKFMFTPTLLVIGIAIGLLVLQQLGNSLGKYSIESVIKTASGAQQDLKQSYYGGNTFNIGDYEPTPSGLLSVAHKAVFAALFRPTLLDVKNVVMGITAIENSFILGFCLYLLIKLRFFKFFSLITSHPLLMFSFIFSIFFAFSVGVSISNYGALVRLKIPCIPFFVSSLVILNDMLNQSFKKKRASQRVSVDEGRVVWSG